MPRFWSGQETDVTDKFIKRTLCSVIYKDQIPSIKFKLLVGDDTDVAQLINFWMHIANTLLERKS